MSTGRVSRTSVLTSASRLAGCGASPRHSAISACSSKRTVRLINGIALDQCRVRERYPARRPAFALQAMAGRPIPNGVMDDWIVGLLGYHSCSSSIHQSTTPLIHFFGSCSPTRRGTTSRASPAQVQTLPRAPAFALRAPARRANFRPASIKVMQRTFNPQNRARYPGGPPSLDWNDGVMDCWSNASTVSSGCLPLIHHSITPLPHFCLPGRLIVGQRPLKARMRVQFQPRQPINRPMVKQDHVSPTKRC